MQKGEGKNSVCHLKAITYRVLLRVSAGWVRNLKALSFLVE